MINWKLFLGYAGLFVALVGPFAFAANRPPLQPLVKTPRYDDIAPSQRDALAAKLVTVHHNPKFDGTAENSCAFFVTIHDPSDATDKHDMHVAACGPQGFVFNVGESDRFFVMTRKGTVWNAEELKGEQ